MESADTIQGTIGRGPNFRVAGVGLKEGNGAVQSQEDCVGRLGRPFHVIEIDLLSHGGCVAAEH